MDLNNYPVPHPQVAAQIIDDEAVLVLADVGEVQVLNPVGARVWEGCDGSRTVQQIIAVIVAEFDVSAAEAERDVVEFLESLVQDQVVVLKSSPIIL